MNKTFLQKRRVTAIVVMGLFGALSFSAMNCAQAQTSPQAASGSACAPTSAQISANASQIATTSANIAQQIITAPPQTISQQSCLSSTLGISAIFQYPSVASILSTLEGMACSALNSVISQATTQVTTTVNGAISSTGLGSIPGTTALVGVGSNTIGGTTGSASVLGGGSISTGTGSLIAPATGAVNTAVGGANTAAGSAISSANQQLTAPVTSSLSAIP